MFGRYLRRILNEIDKFIVGSLGAVFFLVLYTILPHIFPSETMVPFWIFQLVCLICFFICVTMYGIGKVVRNQAQHKDIVIRTFIDGVFILDPNPDLQIGTLLSVHYTFPNGCYEKQIALGEVVNIQNNSNLVQVAIISKEKDFMQDNKLEFNTDINLILNIRMSTIIAKDDAFNISEDHFVRFLKTKSAEFE